MRSFLQQGEREREREDRTTAHGWTDGRMDGEKGNNNNSSGSRSSNAIPSSRKKEEKEEEDFSVSLQESDVLARPAVSLGQPC